MNEHAQRDSEESRLWRQYVAGAGHRPGGGPLDPNLLAAYLDGTACEEEVERVEAAMACDPGLLEEVMQLRALQGAKPEAVPDSLLAGAKALVPVGRSAQGRPRPSRWYDLRSVLPGWRRAAAAAAIVLACVTGFSVGRETHLGQVAAAESAAALEIGLEDLIAEPTFEVADGLDGGNGGGS